ncbi:unnamed protein product [Trichobilharzia regenti]|nr:unnamed protein product [Trichobilharzia regenti]
MGARHAETKVTVKPNVTDAKGEDEDGEDDDDDDDYGKDGGMVPILRVLQASCRRGRVHVYKTIDKYLKKEDLDKKLLEVAKIVGKRFEKRMEYLAKQLDAVFNYETS